MFEGGEVTVRLLLSAVIPAVIGWEREKNHKPAGLRMHMLVCIGATLCSIVRLS